MGIIDDVDAASAWIATALSSSGYRADFTPASLWEVDRFFDEEAPDGKPKSRGLLSEDLGSRIFGIGSYIGEVVRRDRGGEWFGDDADAAAEINVALRLGDGQEIWPVQRAMKRFSNGPEDSIGAYGHVLGLSVGPPPQPPAKRLRRFWQR